jgi:hypothetical protein
VPDEVHLDGRASDNDGLGGDPLPPVGATLGVIAGEPDSVLLAGRAIGLLRGSLTVVEGQNAPGDDPSVARGDEGKDLEYTVSLEVLPEIVPVDFKTIDLERPKAEPGDAEIAKALDSLATSQRKTQKVEEIGRAHV